MLKWYFLALLSVVPFCLAGCGAIDSPALGDQQVVAEQEFVTDPNGEAKFAIVDDAESTNPGNYDEYDAGADDNTDSANNDGGGSSESYERPWIPLTLGGFIGTYQLCGGPTQYTPSEEYLVVSLTAVGGQDPSNTGNYLVEWHFPDGSVLSGTLSSVTSVRVSLTTIGDLVAYVSDDDGEHWKKIVTLSIIPYTYVYYPSEGKGWPPPDRWRG